MNKKIKNNTIISRHKLTNDVVSLYADDIWNFTSYRDTSRGAAKINFINWTDTPDLHREVIAEMKYIVYLLLNEATGGRQSILSTASVCGQYQVVIKRLAKQAVIRKMLISDLLQSTVEIKRYVGLQAYKSSHECFASLLAKLVQLGENRTGMRVLDGKHLSEIRKQTSRSNIQTEFIPQRLLSEFIDHWQVTLHEFNSNWINVKNFLNVVVDQPGSGTSIPIQRAKYSKNRFNYELEFKPLSIDHNLTLYFDKYGITDLKKLTGHLTYMQSVGKSIIHVYSGMRFDEAMSLTVDSLERENVTSNLERWILKGETTKYTGMAKKTVWVTSNEINTAWSVLSNISNYVASRTNCLGNQPLFIAISYLEISCVSVGLDDGIKCTHLAEINPLKHMGDEAVITREDMEVLREIDPHRDWSNSEYKVNSRWHLKSHQFRRTLAILAAQSGLVSIPSLKRQLKHLTEEMTFYYTDGSTNFHSTNSSYVNDFAELMQNSSAEAHAYFYIVDYILSSDKIATKPNYEKKKRTKSKNTLNLLYEDRDKYQKMFEMGEISYRETILGACLKNGVCIDRAHRSFTACLNCPSARIKLPKLDRLICIQQRYLDTLDSSKVEWIVAARELEDLTNYKKKWS